MPSIDLVDLPGLVSADRQRPDRPAETRRILRREVDADAARGGSAFYVAIVPASGDVRPSCNGAMEFVCEQGLADQTFGLFSKCDQLTADSDILRSLMTGAPTVDGDDAGDVGYVPLKRGWVASMLKPPAPAAYFDAHNYERLLRQKRNELAYFRDANDDVLRELHAAGLCGVGALVARLEAQYNDYLHTTWKRGTILKILDKLEDLRFQQDLLGVAVPAGQDALARDEVARRLRDPAVYRAAMAPVAAWCDGAALAACRALDGATIAADEIDGAIRAFRDEVAAGLAAALERAGTAWLREVEVLVTAEVAARPRDAGGLTLDYAHAPRGRRPVGARRGPIGSSGDRPPPPRCSRAFPASRVGSWASTAASRAPSSRRASRRRRSSSSRTTPRSRSASWSGAATPSSARGAASSRT